MYQNIRPQLTGNVYTKNIQNLYKTSLHMGETTEYEVGRMYQLSRDIFDTLSPSINRLLGSKGSYVHYSGIVKLLGLRDGETIRSRSWQPQPVYMMFECDGGDFIELLPQEALLSVLPKGLSYEEYKSSECISGDTSKR